MLQLVAVLANSLTINTCGHFRGTCRAHTDVANIAYTFQCNAILIYPQYIILWLQYVAISLINSTHISCGGGNNA